MTVDTPNVHEQIEQGLKEHPAKKGVLFNVLVTALEVGGSIALFHVARSMGASNVGAYLAGSIAPVIGGIVIWARARKFSGASAAIFSFTAVSALIALIGSTNDKVLLYKDCATTALIGLIFLGSIVVMRKPLVFYMAQRYGSDGTHDGMAVFDMMWENYGLFRRGMYMTTFLWSGLFVVQAAVTALIVHEATYSTAYNYDQILPIVATVLGILGSIVIGRYYAKKGQAQGAAARAAAQAGTPSGPPAAASG